MKYYLFLAGVALVIMGYSKSMKALEKQKNLEQFSFSLNYRIRIPDPTNSKPPLLILLHGFGSNENDLFELTAKLPEDWIIAAPQGPIQLGDNAYCWYHARSDNGKIIINSEEEIQSRKKLLAFIDEIVSVYGADSSRIVIAGFSQGATLSLNAALTHPEKIKGFASFSGRFPEEIRPLISKSESLGSLKSFIAHGNRDALLPVTYASENREALKTLGIQTTYCEDSTGHTISQKQFTAFGEWLKQF